MGYMITEDVRDQGTREERAAKAADWSPTAAQEMCDRVRDLSCPYGGTLGDIFDKTPKDVISKVFLEEKVHPSCISKWFALFFSTLSHCNMLTLPILFSYT